MLKIFNDLAIFFEDCYNELGVREYSRTKWISPPTASALLRESEKEGLLLLKKEKKKLSYRANRENLLFIDISKAYWRQKLYMLTKFLSEVSNYESIILFGSLIKGEATTNSDIDIYLNCNFKEIILEKFEKQLKRNIQLHFKSELKNESLKKSIQQGLLLYGAMI